MYMTFRGAKAFNQALVWDTSKVTSLHYTFNSAGAFNAPLDWDTSSVTNMASTFWDARAFDQQLEWDTWLIIALSLLLGLVVVVRQRQALRVR